MDPPLDVHKVGTAFPMPGRGQVTALSAVHGAHQVKHSKRFELNQCSVALPLILLSHNIWQVLKDLILSPYNIQELLKDTRITDTRILHS